MLDKEQIDNWSTRNMSKEDSIKHQAFKDVYNFSLTHTLGDVQKFCHAMLINIESRYKNASSKV